MDGTGEAAIDREEVAGSPRSDGPDTNDAEMMRRELQSVIASPDFARAPIMKRLLCFLVEETAGGRGDQLKAYSVAVDGLGRAPDYDSRADSYPRVQVGRLRRMLDGYYSSTAPVDGYRLTIPSGRYRVALQSADASSDPAIEAIEPARLTEPRLAFGWQVALLLALLLLGTATLLRILPMRTIAPGAGHARPVLELSGVDMARTSRLGNVIRAALLNGLGRSGIYDLRAVRRSGTPDPQAVPARYRLSTDLLDGERPRLFLRLTRLSPDRLIWSGDIALPAGTRLDGDGLEHALAPAIATIGRVDGLIATHELQENGGLEAAGYSCLLLYHRYRKERTDAEFDHVRTCIDRSLARNPDDAELQAAAAQLAIEKMVRSETPARDRPALLLTAQRHAQISASIDPRNPWNTAARARIAVLRGDCSQAIGFALRASELQPFDPALLADAGLYLLDCGDPRAEPLIRRAIALDDNPDGRFFAPLLLLAIERNDRQLAREALGRMTPPLFGRHGGFHLISATGYAMIGDIARGRAAWSRLAASNPGAARDPQGFFERLGYAPQLRAKAIRHLGAAGLLRS